MKPLFLHILNAFWNDPAAAQHWLIGLAILAGLYFIVFRWPVMQPVRHALWTDEQAVKRWAWGAGSFLATLASMVFIGGVEQAMAWSARQWLANIITALIALTVGMVSPTGKSKAADAAPAAPPQAGFVRIAVLAAIFVGVLQFILVGAAFNSFGLRAHGWAVFCIAAGVAQAWLIMRAFPDLRMW